MSPGGGAATTALTDIGKKILGKEDLDVDGLKSNIRSKFGEVEENGYDYERETTDEVRKQRVRAQRLVDFLDSGEAKIPYSALRSQKDLTSYVDDLKQSAVDMIAVLNGGITQMYPKGATKQEKTFSVQDLPKEAQKQIEEIQKSIEESFKDFDVKEKVGEKTIAVMNYMQAESDFDEATGNKRPKFTRTNKENALKALEGDSAGADQSDDEESKSLDEMSPQELKESLEEAIEKSNMDPEEKKKAIKRMKKMKPEDMKAQMIAMMGDEEGEAMGKQARLKKARSLLRQIEANEALIYNLERKLKIALRR